MTNEVVPTYDNKIASKVNNAFDIVTGRKKIPNQEDISYDIFEAVITILGLLSLAAAVYVVASNFGFWIWSSPKIETCDEGLFLVGRTAIEVLIFLLFGFTFVKGNDNEGEIRKSVTISVMVMFYGLVAIHCNEVLDTNSVAGMVLDKYWAVVVAVTGYYFASRTVEELKNPE